MARSITAGFLSIFSAQLATSIITIVALPVIVRLLGPGGYGDYAFLMSVFSVWMILISSGVTEGVQKFVGEQRDSAAWSEQVIGYYARIAVVLSILGAAALVAAVELGVIDRLFDERFDGYFYLLAAFVVAAQFREFASRTLMGFSLERYSEPLRVIYVVVWIGLGIYLGYRGFGVSGFIGGHVVASAIVAVLGFGIIFRRVSLRKLVASPDADFPRRRLLTFNALNIVLVLLVMSLYHVDVMMLRVMLGSEQTGYYKAALALAEYLWMVPISLQALLLHSTADLWVKKDHDRITDLAGRITRFTLLFTCLLALGIGALADSFVPIYYGEEFTQAIVPLLVLLPGSVAFAVARPIYAISQGKGDLKPVVAATGVAAVLNLALNLLLIPVLGIVGAGIATGIGYGSMFLLHVRSARSLGFQPLVDVRALRIVVTVVVGAAVIFGTDALLASDFVSLVVVPVVGFLGYAATAITTGAIDRAEFRDMLAAVVPGGLWSRFSGTTRSE